MGSYWGMLQALCDYRTRESVVLSRFTASPKNRNELLTNIAILIDPKNKTQKNGQLIAAMGGKFLYGHYAGPLPEQVTLFCFWSSVLAKDTFFSSFIQAFKMCLDDDDLKFASETHNEVLCMQKCGADAGEIKSNTAINSHSPTHCAQMNTAISFVTLPFDQTFQGERARQNLQSAMNQHVLGIDSFGCAQGPRDDEMQLFIIWENVEAAADNSELLHATLSVALKHSDGEKSDLYTCKACVYKSAPTA